HKCNRLVKSLGARRREPGFFELLHGVRLRLLDPFASGVAALHQIVRQKFHMLPPGLPVKVSGGLLSTRSYSQCEQRNCSEYGTHDDYSKNRFEALENSREMCVLPESASGRGSLDILCRVFLLGFQHSAPHEARHRARTTA